MTPDAPSLVLSAGELLPVVRGALTRGQHVRFTATGGSMAPFLRHGDVVEIAPLTAAPTIGDVLLVRCPGDQYVLHRVVRWDGRHGYLRGDAQATMSGPFALDDVLGRAVSAERNGRTWSLCQGPAWHLARLWCRTWPLGPRLLEVRRAVRRWFGVGGTTAAPRAADRAFDQLLALLRPGALSMANLGAVDWDTLVPLAQRLGVAPLLAGRIRSLSAAPALPPATEETLRQIRYQNAARNTRILHELAGVLTALSANQVPVIVLKGAYLAEAVYGDIALRPMADVDLMVPPRAVQRAAEVLADLGYRLPDGACCDGWQRPDSKHLPPLRRPDALVSVELHWSLVGAEDAPAVNPREWWATSERTTVAGAPARALCPEELVLHLCLHLVHSHRFSNDMRALADLAAAMVCFADRLDWTRVLESVTRRRWRRGVLLALWLAHDWLGAPLPTQVVGEIGADPSVVARATDARILLLTEQPVPVLRELLPSTWWFRPTGEAPNKPAATLHGAFRRAPAAFVRRAPALLAALGALGPARQALRARVTIDGWLADETSPRRR